MAQIHEAVQAILSEIPAISKDRRNQQQGFQYRGIDDVMNALNPLLSKHGVFCTPEVLERHREERETKSGGILAFTTLTVRYTFWAKDGSNVAAVVVGEGMDSGDKSTNKALAVAMKYAMFQVFCIPTEEMHDPDADTPPEIVGKGKKSAHPQGEGTNVKAAARNKAWNDLRKKFALESGALQSVRAKMIEAGLLTDTPSDKLTDNAYYDMLIGMEEWLTRNGIERASA